MRYLVAALVLAWTAPSQAAGPIRVGAAESVYADIAAQIGGPALTVDVLSKPKQQARAGDDGAAVNERGLDIVICNGLGYDAWINEFLAHAGARPVVLEAGRFLPQAPGQHPVAWYDFKATQALARALAAELARRDAAESALFAKRLEIFESAMQPLNRKVEEIAAVYAGSNVLLADNLYRSVVDALRLKVQDEGYLKATASRSEPDAKSLAALKQSIVAGGASVLIYNSEAKSGAITELVSLANDKGLPVVGVRETKPAGLNYQQWMLRQLNITHGALNEAAP